MLRSREKGRSGKREKVLFHLGLFLDLMTRWMKAHSGGEKTSSNLAEKKKEKEKKKMG